MVMCAAGYASFRARTVGVVKITSPIKAKSMTNIRSPATPPPPFASLHFTLTTKRGRRLRLPLLSG